MSTFFGGRPDRHKIEIQRPCIENRTKEDGGMNMKGQTKTHSSGEVEVNSKRGKQRNTGLLQNCGCHSPIKIKVFVTKSKHFFGNSFHCGIHNFVGALFLFVSIPCW